jgi:hypothetical protein
MTRTERFLFSTGLGWELARLLAVFTPTAACLCRRMVDGQPLNQFCHWFVSALAPRPVPGAPKTAPKTVTCATANVSTKSRHARQHPRSLPVFKSPDVDDAAGSGVNWSAATRNFCRASAVSRCLATLIEKPGSRVITPAERR